MPSPYHTHQKQPYPYVYPRCSHGQSFVQRYKITSPSGVEVSAKVRVCSVCNTTLAPAFNVHTFQPRRIP